MRQVRLRPSAVIVAALALAGAALTATTTSASAADPTSVTVSGSTHALNGVNIYRSANFLVEYTPAFGASTQTNQYGCEAAVVNGAVTKVQNGVGNMTIPAGGFVLSGHGTSRTWLCANASVGAPVSFDGGGGGGGGTAVLPNLRMRNLNDCPHKPCFFITTVNGVKELKFPVVMSNVGNGPFEIHGTRSSSTSTDWASTQTIFNSDGSKTVVSTPAVTFFYAGDGHNHWHVKDLQKYVLLDSNGNNVDTGNQAKTGFCFEDNTSYRDWPSNGTNGAPANPVYLEQNSCGVGHPEATSIMEGLSVGWGDTYPSTLPNQYIDITNVPNGTYTVKVTADWADWYQETNNSDNTASAKITISGSTVTVLSQSGGA